MTLRTLLKKSERLLRTNSPAILTAIGITGTISTAYLAGKASWEAQFCFNDRYDLEAASFRERVERTWKLYIPAGVSGILTISAIAMASRVSSKRTTAITSALALSDKAFQEYKDKVVETIGENKERKIRDQIAQNKVDSNPPSERHLMISSPGNVMCCELLTGRYFTSDMESLRRAENDLNAMLVRSTYAYLSDFYHLIGLPDTSQSQYIGWESDKMLELSYSTALAENGHPCITFEYNYTKPL